jgi:type IV pilus biogenesis protein PilP
MNAKPIALLLAGAAPFVFLGGCKSGEESARQELQERGYDLTPEAFFRAAESDDTTALETLLKHGIAADIRNAAGDSALHAAAAAGMRKSADFLLDRRVAVDLAGAEGRTPLMTAVLHGTPEMVRYLLSQKADPLKKDAQGLTPLMLAVRAGRGDMVGELAPYDRTKLDDALLVAALDGKAGVIDALTQYGASVYARMDDGRTPLMLAAENGHLEAVDMLLVAGANRFSMDDEGRIASDHARQAGHEELALRLSEAPEEDEFALEEPADLGAEMLARVSAGAAEAAAGAEPGPSEVAAPPLLEGAVIAADPAASAGAGDPTEAEIAAGAAPSPAPVPLAMRAYRRKELPLRVESVDGDRAALRLPGGEVLEATTGATLPGTPLKVVRIERRMQEIKDGDGETEVSVVEVEDVHSGRTRELISGLEAAAHDPVALVEDGAGRHFLARSGQKFQGGDGASYRVADVRPNQMVIENLTTGEVFTLPLRGPRG